MKNKKDFALYKDIAAIDTNYIRTALTYAPCLEVTRRDSCKFRVHVDGKDVDVRSFFEDVLVKWKTEKMVIDQP